MHAARQKGKNWGELPPKERDRILQSRNQGFPANYDKVLERYYKRLAEEKNADETVNDAKSGGSGEDSDDAPAAEADETESVDKPSDAK